MRVYEFITERIITLLTAGTIPWRKPWRGGACAPQNLVTKKPYRGINAFLLACSQFGSPYWLTYKQAERLGGHVRRGQRSCPIVFWNWVEREKQSETEPGPGSFPVLRYYNVFNIQQCELPAHAIPLPPELSRLEFQPLARCENVVGKMPVPPAIAHDGADRAYYNPFDDGVHLPAREQFDSPAGYYATLFHELAHATGHPRRLGRRGVMERHSYGEENYSKEELVAEMGSAFLCGYCGIDAATLSNQASYIAGWLQALSDDRRLVIQAASSAQKAADFILGQPDVTSQKNATAQAGFLAAA